jgi:preprotein translocase subunit SecY
MGPSAGGVGLTGGVMATILNSFRVPEIRRKLAFTAGMLLLYRIGSYIPAPGINTEAVKNIANENFGSNVLGFLNLFSGGSLQRFAIFALGIMPYITASIILQLMQVVVPSLEKLRKEGEVGQQKITQYTRYLTVFLAFFQSIWYVFLFRSFARGSDSVVTNFTFLPVLAIVASLTAGTVLVMWLGELITQRGIGNGISLMIFASIVARLPHGISAWWSNPDAIFKVMMPFVVIAVLAGIVFMQEGQRRIPVQYAKRVIGRRMSGGQSTYLPLRVNMAGVIPVIFAASLMAFPPTVGELIHSSWAKDLSNFFSPNGAAYLVGESILIIVFTYFYTAVTFNPVEQADNLKKYGGFIPGVRPGRPTAEFLDRILARLTFPGALYLAAVAALPTILINQTSANFFFGGTSILIVVGVALDTMKQLEAQLMMRNYEGFLK